MSIFFAGVTLNLVPCVNPLIPITAARFGGRSGRYQPNLIGNAISYALGVSFTSAVLASWTALTGKNLESLPLYPLLLGLVCAMLILLASRFFGWWGKESSDGSTEPGKTPPSGHFSNLIVGLVLGIVALPSTSGTVAGLHRWVESLGSPTLAFLIFITLSLGVAAPLFLLAVLSGRVDKLRHFGESRLWARKLAAWLLVGSAIYVVRPILPAMAALVVSVAAALSAGIHLGWIYNGDGGLRPLKWIRVCVGLACLAIAAFLIGAWMIQG